MFNFKFFILIFAICIIVLSGCNAIDDKTTLLISEITESARPNVVIISMDTVRADHLSCYGYHGKTSPNLDRLAGEGILFKNAIAQSSWTLPSHVSLMTSLYPDVHQVYARDRQLSNNALTLAEILKLYGYQTAAFTGGFDVHSRHGLNQGFDVYECNDSGLGGFTQTISQSVNWLKTQRLTHDARRKTQPFFIFLHGYDAHIPGPEEVDGINPAWLEQINQTDIRPEIKQSLMTGIPDWLDLSPSQAEINYVQACYEAKISEADKQIGEFFKVLKTMNLYEHTLIIILSDHGESFGKHNTENYLYVNKNDDNQPLTLGGAEHGNVYEEGIHVPLIIKLPLHLQSTIGNLQSRIDTQVQLIDVLPTILDYAGIPILHQAQGQSLKPLISLYVKSKIHNLQSEINMYVFSNGALGEGVPYRALVRTNEWKLIYVESDEKNENTKDEPRITTPKGPRTANCVLRLYDLVRDRGETRNVVFEHPEAAAELEEQLFKWLEQNRSVNGSKQNLTFPIPTGITAQMQEEVRRAGYWAPEQQKFESKLIVMESEDRNQPVSNIKFPTSSFNIIWIVIGSLRADHLKCYGYQRETAPHISRLAEESVVFNQAIGQSYWTLPSHASMLTSQYPSTHGVWERGQSLPEQSLTLPEILKMYNYETAAFTGGLDLKSVNNLDQGFDSYDDGKSLARSADLVPLVIKWLESKNQLSVISHQSSVIDHLSLITDNSSPFFLYLHTYDGHAPYEPPSPYHHIFDDNYKGILDEIPLSYEILKTVKNDKITLNGREQRLNPQDCRHITAHYDGSIFYGDKYLGELMAELRELDLYDNSLIILSSDHGEELGDHGSFDRFGAQNLYDEVIRVPLIIKFPAKLNSAFRIPHSVITEQVQLIDIMPTILNLLNIDVNKESQGQSLLSLISGGSSLNLKPNTFNLERPAFAEANAYKQTIRTGEWKLIRKADKAGIYFFKELPKPVQDNLEGEGSAAEQIIYAGDETYELYNLTEHAGEIKEYSRESPDEVYRLLQKLLEFIKTVRTGRPVDKKELPPALIKELKKHGYWESK